MKKTVTITIGGSLFHIEEDAYNDLDAYLTSIRRHFASYDDAEEIVSDIEGRIAEEFTEGLKKAHRAAVNEGDVMELKQRMGTTEDFAAFDADAPKAEKKEESGFNFGKRLYRDTEGPMIAGVAKGIANYFGIDPVIVRILFIILTFFGGAGIPVYIVLWIVVPEAKTPSERAEMSGGQLTLKKIEATIRKVPEATKNIDKGALNRAVQAPFTALRSIIAFLGRLLRGVIPFLGRLLGVLICIGAMLGMFFLTFWLIIFLTGSWEQYMDVPVRQLAGDGVFYGAVICAYLLLLIPGIGLFTVGMSLSKMKNMFTFPAVMALGIVWLSSALTGAVLAASNGPAFATKVEAYINEFDTESTKNIPLSAFTNIDASHSYHVRVRKGTAYSMKATGPTRAMEQLQTNVEDGTLVIRREGRGTFCIFCLERSATIEITTPSPVGNIISQAGAGVDIDGVAVTGDRITAVAGAKIDIHHTVLPEMLHLTATAGSRIATDSTREITDLLLDAKAGSRIEYTGNATAVTANAAAGSRLVLTGTGKTLTATILAGSRMEAAEFAVTDASVTAAAGGHVVVNVSGTLSGTAHGGGEIRYVKEPAKMTVDTHPSGYVDILNEYD